MTQKKKYWPSMFFFSDFVYHNKPHTPCFSHHIFLFSRLIFYSVRQKPVNNEWQWRVCQISVGLDMSVTFLKLDFVKYETDTHYYLNPDAVQCFHIQENNNSLFSSKAKCDIIILAETMSKLDSPKKQKSELILLLWPFVSNYTFLLLCNFICLNICWPAVIQKITFCI